MTDPRNITMAALVDALIDLGKLTRALSTMGQIKAKEYSIALEFFK